MGCYCAPGEQSTDPNSVFLGRLCVKITTSLPPSVDTLIVVTNPSMELDPYESKLEHKEQKQKYVINKGFIKNGSVARLKINKQGVKQVIYMAFPERDNALLEFRIHQSIMKALETAFEYDMKPKVGIAIPMFAELNLDQKVYEAKLMNALRLFSIGNKQGFVYVQVGAERVKEVVKVAKKRVFEAGECDQE